MADNTPATKSGRTETAGAFDIRNVIGALMLIYGVILTVMGLIDHHSNLWTGLGMLVVGVVFVVWAALRPTVVQQREPSSSDAQAKPNSDAQVKPNFPGPSSLGAPDAPK